MNIAIIPARGGSKRILHKNSRLFFGKPIIAYAIELAMKSNCFDKIIVSTDSDKIANIAKKYGAEVPFIRPKNISDDYATTLDVMQHAVNWNVRHHKLVNFICCIYPCTPLLQVKDILYGYEVMLNQAINYSFSACEYAHPIQRGFKLNKQHLLTQQSVQYEASRSQTLEAFYHDAGQFYWGTTDAFIKKSPIFTSNSRAILIPRSRAIDIDTQEDWLLAEALFAFNHQQGSDKEIA